MGDWQAGSGGLDQLNVSVEHLGNIKSYLDTVAGGIRDDLRPLLHNVNRMATTGGDESRSALGGMEIREVSELAQRIQGTFQAIDGSLKSIAEQLEKDGAAIATIAEKYQAVESRNAVTAVEFMSAMNG